MGWDSEASALTDWSKVWALDVEVASGFCWVSCGGLAGAAPSDVFGVELVFLSSRFGLGVLTSFSMAVARDFGPFELP